MVDDDGRTPDHGHPLSSPCELKIKMVLKGHKLTSSESANIISRKENWPSCGILRYFSAQFVGIGVVCGTVPVCVSYTYI